MTITKGITNSQEVIDMHQDHKILKKLMIVIMSKHMIILKDQEQQEQLNSQEDKGILIHLMIHIMILHEQEDKMFIHPVELLNEIHIMQIMVYD
jgi:hypothetical protein